MTLPITERLIQILSVAMDSGRIDSAISNDLNISFNFICEEDLVVPEIEIGDSDRIEANLLGIDVSN